LISAWSFEMFSFAINSSRTFSEVLFSLAAMFAGCGVDEVAAGIFLKKGIFRWEKLFLCDKRRSVR
jgi:hypothetical protein